MKKIILFSKVRELIYKWSLAPQYVYLCIAVIGVVCFSLVTPPFQGPDEEAHYVRVQYIAHGYFIPVSVKDTGASLPKSLEAVIKATFYDDDLRGKSADKYELSRTRAALSFETDSSSSYKPTMISYSPVPYLPAIPGVFIANLLNLNPLISMYIARLSLGLTSVVLMFFAIKFIPHKKYLFVAVGLIPMLLFQQAMVTVDGISYAILALFICYVLYLNMRKSIQKKEWILLGIICIGLVLVKPLVWLFLPIIFILVRKKHAPRWIAGVIVVSLIALFGITAFSNVKNRSVSVSTIPDNVSTSSQLENLRLHPARGLRVAWNTYMTTYGDEEVRGVIGIFGPADTPYPLWMFSLYVVVLGLVCFTRLDEKKERNILMKWKVLTALMAAAYFAAVNLALYLSYTPVNFDIVYGVQGRYFLPIIIAVAAVIFTGGVKLSKTDSKKTKLILTITLLCLVMLAIYTVIQRYYLYTP